MQWLGLESQFWVKKYKLNWTQPIYPVGKINQLKTNPIIINKGQLEPWITDLIWVEFTGLVKIKNRCHYCISLCEPIFELYMTWIGYYTYILFDILKNL